MNKATHLLFFLAILFCFNNVVCSENYVLQRGTVVYSNGLSFDTLRGDMTATGTMTLNGNALTQFLSVCFGEACDSASLTANIISVGINGSSVHLRHPDGSVSEVLLISNSPIMTLTDGGDFVEVDQWVLANTLSNISNQDIEENKDLMHIDSSEPVIFGTSIGSVLQSLEATE